MDESVEENGRSVAAPVVFVIVLVFQLISLHLENTKKKLSMSATDVQLREEIKRLLKEASSYSQPSTFAQAAKLRRTAAAKEKELAKNQELLSKEMKLTYDSHVKKLMILKVSTYSVLILWFWRNPIAAIPEQLVQPFGGLLSWRAGDPSNNSVMVGIIPWLILSTRVGKIVCRRIIQ